MSDEPSRALIEGKIKTAREFYEKTGNPVFVWEALLWTVWCPENIPDFVLEYLGRCSRALLELTYSAQGSEPPTNLAPKISRAVEFSSERGGHGAIHDWVRLQRNLDLENDMKVAQRDSEAAPSDWAAAQGLATDYGFSSPKAVLAALRKVREMDLPDQSLSLDIFYALWSREREERNQGK